MSDKRKWPVSSRRRKQKNRRQFAVQRQRSFEVLESRTLLSVSAQLKPDGTGAEFVGDAAADQLWLRVGAASQLEYSTDGTSFSSDFAGSQLALDGEVSVAVNLGAGDDVVRFVHDLMVDTTVVGGLGNDTIVGPDKDIQWVLTGADAGTLNSRTAFSGVENVTGGAGADQFAVRTGGTLSGGLDGGGGNDTLIGPNSANSWNLSGADAGTLVDPQDLSSGGDLIFRARRIGTAEIENLLPSGYLAKSV